MRWVPTTDGLQLAVHDLAGAGPALVFAHATGFHGMVWAPLAVALGGDHRCWSWDFRGHGASVTPVGQPFPWHSFGEDASAVVEALQVAGTGLIGVGHSMGGAALLMAEIAHPGTFAGLFLYEPIVLPASAGGADHGGNHLAEGSRRRRPSFGSRDEAFANYASKPPLNTLDPAALRAYVDYGFVEVAGGGVTLACRRDDEARVFEAGTADRTFDRLDAVRCPVVVAHGDVADITDHPARLAPSIAARLPAGAASHFVGLNHFGPLQAPARVAVAIMEWANTL